MNSSKVPVLETLANSISQPNDQDNAIAFNSYFANLGFEISKHPGVGTSSSKTSPIDVSVESYKGGS